MCTFTKTRIYLQEKSKMIRNNRNIILNKRHPPQDQSLPSSCFILNQTKFTDDTTNNNTSKTLLKRKFKEEDPTVKTKTTIEIGVYTAGSSDVGGYSHLGPFQAGSSELF